MSNVYLIADASVNGDAVMEAANDFNWVWLDEKEETERSPYTMSFERSDSQARIWYYEEHKDVFEARYFIIGGSEATKTVEQIRSRFGILSKEMSQMPLLILLQERLLISLAFLWKKQKSMWNWQGIIKELSEEYK